VLEPGGVHGTQGHGVVRTQDDVEPIAFGPQAAKGLDPAFVSVVAWRDGSDATAQSLQCRAGTRGALLCNLLLFNSVHELTLELKISERDVINNNVLLHSTLQQHFFNLF
jgi:hypothetical protein